MDIVISGKEKIRRTESKKEKSIQLLEFLLNVIKANDNKKEIVLEEITIINVLLKITKTSFKER